MIRSLILFFAPLLSGLLIYLMPKGRKANYKLLLVFAGSYLFAITVSHILPELYIQHRDINFIGLCVLAGFFLQQVLEYFSSGIEHGHLHTHDHDHDHNHNHAHVHPAGSAVVLLIALCIHAFLEGSMLAQPPDSTPIYDVDAVLLGIVLHRIPAAFALMTVLVYQLGSKNKALIYLILFSAAAPIGLLLNTYLAGHQIINETGLIYIYALVCGNFLYISTTIVFESSPEHKFNGVRLLVGVAGALAAIGVEYFS